METINTSRRAQGDDTDEALGAVSAMEKATPEARFQRASLLFNAPIVPQIGDRLTDACEMFGYTVVDVGSNIKRATKELEEQQGWLGFSFTVKDGYRVCTPAFTVATERELLERLLVAEQQLVDC